MVKRKEKGCVQRQQEQEEKYLWKQKQQSERPLSKKKKGEELPETREQLTKEQQKQKSTECKYSNREEEGKDATSSNTLSAILTKFQELKERREEAVAANLASTKIEDAQLRLDPRTRARLERKKAQAQDYLSKQAAAATGVDLERQNNLTYTIEETEQWRERQVARRAAADPGFTDYAQLTARKYEKLTQQLDPAALLRRTKEEALEAMAHDVKEQQRKRMQLSRRRRFDDTEDVTYINERNYRFNKKASRAYDDYTQELRDSLERGTAL